MTLYADRDRSEPPTPTPLGGPNSGREGPSEPRTGETGPAGQVAPDRLSEALRAENAELRDLLQSVGHADPARPDQLLPGG